MSLYMTQLSRGELRTLLGAGQPLERAVHMFTYVHMYVCMTTIFTLTLFEPTGIPFHNWPIFISQFT